MTIHTTDLLAKQFSEAVKAIDPRPVEGIRSTSASRLQKIFYSVIPQLLPLWISLSLHRFESNVRSATVLGIEGAGGVEMSLMEALRGIDCASCVSIQPIIRIQHLVLAIMVAFCQITSIFLAAPRIRRQCHQTVKKR